jgi:hypothetical protein
MRDLFVHPVHGERVLDEVVRAEAEKLIGGAAAGIIGAFLAVPLVASLEIILARFQARSIPIAQDPSVASVEVSTDEGAVESRAQQAAVAPD